MSAQKFDLMGTLLRMRYAKHSYPEADEAIATVVELIAATKPFAHADLCKQLPGNSQGDDSPIYCRDKAVLKLGDFRKAASAVARIGSDA